MPAAAVIPAPTVYIKVVAVKKLVAIGGISDQQCFEYFSLIFFWCDASTIY